MYVGDVLKGYGNLLVVKHDEHYLSAYTHNHIIYIAEGRLIKQNDMIGFGWA